MTHSRITFTASLALVVSLVAASPARLPQLHTHGNQILDSNGKPVRLCGVNTACMEWSSDGEGHILDTVRVAIHDWNVNIIRLPLSQDRWFGVAPEQKDKGEAYQALVQKVVDYCATSGCYVLLDLHWNDCNQWGSNIGQHVMPDMNSVTFWRSCARAYRNNPAVLFDLYNEPHNISWDIWLKGGVISETNGAGARQGRFVPRKYITPGMQSLLDTVRNEGANNVIVCGGLDWAYDLSGFLKGYALKDTYGNGVIYACHAYNNKGESVDKWLSHLDAARPKIPVIMSEFGDQGRGANANKPTPWIARVVAEMDLRKSNYIAWDLHPAASPCLIANWDYKPTPSFGEVVLASLKKR